MNEKNLENMVDMAFEETLAPTTSENKIECNTPEEYLEKTGKRFRLTKKEIEQYTSTPAGRQLAFDARKASNTLVF